MQKQISILAAAIAATGLSAFGQDWTALATTGNNIIWDEFTLGGSVGEVAGYGDVNIEMLWSVNGIDLLPNVGGDYGVFTTGVTSVASVNPQMEIANMLLGGWSLAQNYNSGIGAAAPGTVETITEGTTGKKGGAILVYNNADLFEISPTSTGVDGSDIEVVLIGFNGSASSYSTASDIGWSSVIDEPISLTDANPYIDFDELVQPFGVAPVPEPAIAPLAAFVAALMFLGRRKQFPNSTEPKSPGPG